MGFIDPQALAAKLDAKKPALPGLMGARLGKTFVARDLQGKPVEVVLQKYLAHGHFGDVYLAVDSRGERYAAKFLREVRQVEDWKGKPWDTTLESDNLRAAAATGDHRLVGGLGSGTLQGTHEPGVLIAWAGDDVKTLSETWSDPQQRRVPGKAARIAREVLHALSSLHGAGLEHGDVGPTNVMIAASDATATVRLIDPGNARGVTAEKIKDDLRGVARLLTALLEGKSFDRKQTSAPALDGIDARGLSAADADEFRRRARAVLQKAFDGGYEKAWDMWSDVHTQLADTRFG